MNTSPLAVGLIGITGYGAVHYRFLRQQESEGRLQLRAATVINPEQAPDTVAELRASGVSIHASFEEMLSVWKDRLQLITIPTAIGWHHDMTVAALQAGAHVLVEKPLAATVQEGFSIMAHQQRSGRLVAVGFQELYSEQTTLVKRFLLDNGLGRIRRLRGWVCWPRSSSYYSRNHWAGHLRSQNRWVLDSPVNNACAHYLMQMLFFASPRPDSPAAPISVQGELYRANPIESFDTAFLRIQTDEGIPLHFAVTHAVRELRNPEIIIECERGQIVWRLDAPSQVIHADGTILHLVPTSKRSKTDQMMDSVMARLTGQTTFICEPSQALQHTLVVNGLHQSTPIHAIDGQFIAEESAGDSSQRFIQGIFPLLNSCHEQASFPSELGIPWAKPPGPVFSLEGYREFSIPLS